MLTRAQVAKRLGRSIATVRRLEGSELRPWRDARGVHRFALADVERVLVRRAAGLPSAASAGLVESGRRVASTRTTASTDCGASESSAVERLTQIQHQLLEALEPLSERQLARLPGDLVGAILAAIEPS